MSRSSQTAASRILETDPRQRFNWGYWDGRTDRDSHSSRIATWFGKIPHFDRVYEKGYLHGRFESDNPRTSDTAWLLYLEWEAAKSAA